MTEVPMTEFPKQPIPALLAQWEMQGLSWVSSTARVAALVSAESELDQWGSTAPRQEDALVSSQPQPVHQHHHAAPRNYAHISGDRHFGARIGDVVRRRRRGCSRSRSRSRRTAAKASDSGKISRVTRKSASSAPTGCQ